MEYAPTSETAGTAKVKLEIAPKEDLYESSEKDAEVNDAASRDFDEQTNTVERAQNNDIRIPDERMAEINRRVAEHNRLINKANRPWHKVAAKAGSSFTVYGTVDAAYEFKTWRFRRPRLEQRIADQGEPKSALGNDPNVVGSADAKALAKQMTDANNALAKALKDASADLDRLSADKKQQTQQRLNDRLSVLKNATQPGTKYAGPYLIGGISRTLVVEFTKADAATKQVEAVFSVLEDGRLRRQFQGSLELSEGGQSPDLIRMTSASPGIFPPDDKNPVFFWTGDVRPQLTLQSADVMRCFVKPFRGWWGFQGEVTLKKMHP